jgi:hypothetical protein
MSATAPSALSRPLAVAETLLKRPVSEHEIAAKTVVLTGEPETLSNDNGRWCLLDALRLVSRFVGKLIVALPANPGLRAEVAKLVAGAGRRCRVTICDATDSVIFKGAHAILNVGSTVPPGLPWTSINSNGWVARVSSHVSLPTDSQQPNPIAALMAASLGATEVFKRILDLPTDVAPVADLTEFSLFELNTSPTGLGPHLPPSIALPNTLLTGGGAIGNGIVLLLSQLPFSGRLHVIDRQDYGEENLGTCLLMEAQGWIDRPKAERLREWLSNHSTLAVTAEKIGVEHAIATGRFGGLRFEVLLNGLDDPEPRRQTQRLWPRALIDGGINEFGAAVIQHRTDRPGQACLMCWFKSAEIDERALQSQWTGLPTSTLEDASRLITDDDIASAAPEKQQWLRQRHGRTVCSVITEAQMAQSLGTAVAEGFRPSVPFVAAASAALVVAAAAKYLVWPEAGAPSLFQMGNLFLGPGQAVSLKRSQFPECLCVTQRDRIHRLQGQGTREMLGANHG